MGFIKLTRVTREGNRLAFYFDTNTSFFKGNSFFVEYENTEINAPESIINIIFAGIMAPISWASGADLEISCLDNTYIEALNNCRKYFEKWQQGRWSFKGKLITRAIENKYEADRYGMLFSGGLDALTSYAKHKDKKPILFMIFGSDIPVSEKICIENCKRYYSAFSEEQNIEINWIYSNINDVLNKRHLSRFSKNWNAAVAYGLTLSAMTAPATFMKIKEVIIASTNCGAAPYMWGSDIELDREIRWGNTVVVPDNNELTRTEKIRYYFKGQNALYKYLRVCFMQHNKFNCSRCEKCLRTILGLLINNIDPALCNFHINNKTLPGLKKKLTFTLTRHRIFHYLGMYTIPLWRELQDNIDCESLEDLYGSKEFFKWFKEFKPIKNEPSLFLIWFWDSVLKVNWHILRFKEWLVRK